MNETFAILVENQLPITAWHWCILLLISIPFVRFKSIDFMKTMSLFPAETPLFAFDSPGKESVIPVSSDQFPHTNFSFTA